MSLHVLGIRHHGPGCARSLRAALDELRPDVIVLEGPADAEEAIALASHAEMKPPVALLLYPVDEPRRGVYYPLALFSPEWQAIRWAYHHQVPVRLMDLPQAMQLSLPSAERQPPVDEHPEDEERRVGEENAEEVDTSPSDSGQPWRTDPIALLAEAAGYQDHELWWEEQVERRENANELFTAIHEAMSSVRQECPEAQDRDLLREAYMRQTIRAVKQEAFQRIAVVCGAWHAPVLDEDALFGEKPGCSAKYDSERLKGLRKVKTTATWIPWTHSRLTYRSGYGAGIRSPGWYSHIWEKQTQAPLRWVTAAARLLRSSDLDASSAGVIDTVRLAETLAALRERRSPGLAELNEAILTVLCHGEPAPLRLIHDRLEIGDVLGETPKDAQAVPLMRDLQHQQKSLRLKPSSEVKTLDLDLRKEIDRGRSRLLHRLELLDIAWGSFQRLGGMASTFHEVWQLAWKPELAVEVIEASIWGNTIQDAATSKALDAAAHSSDIPAIAALVDKALLADLGDAVDPLLARLQNQSAVSADVRQLMNALPALARVARYGDVRGTQAASVLPILAGMFERALVGLVPACSSLDDDAAEELAGCFSQVQQALDLLQRADLEEEWHQHLRQLIGQDVQGLLRGYSCRLLLEKGKMEAGEFHRITRLALSSVNEPAAVAAWITGFLRGSGMVLLHQEELWRVFDHWLQELPETKFTEMVPLLRRAFADFTGPERRQMGEKVKRLSVAKPSHNQLAADSTIDFNPDRARRVLPVLAQILGVKWEDQSKS